MRNRLSGSGIFFALNAMKRSLENLLPTAGGSLSFASPSSGHFTHPFCLSSFVKIFSFIVRLCKFLMFCREFETLRTMKNNVQKNVPAIGKCPTGSHHVYSMFRYTMCCALYSSTHLHSLPMIKPCRSGWCWVGILYIFFVEILSWITAVILVGHIDKNLAWVLHVAWLRGKMVNGTARQSYITE